MTTALAMREPPVGRDIVVTIPASRIAAVEEEEALVFARIRRGEKAGRGGWQFYWSMGRLPRAQPRRIYFAWYGAVRAWHAVLSMVTGGWSIAERCVSEERDQSRSAIFMHPTINGVEPIPMSPFRGFRYFDETEARNRFRRGVRPDGKASR